VGSWKFGDLLKWKDNITIGFMKRDVMFPSALMKPRAGHLNKFL
jgi:hypothetical protein